MAEQSIRFGIRSPDGKRSATWKCFAPRGVGKSDIYLLNRNLGGTIKTSLHESGYWHNAYVKKFYDERVPDSLKEEKGRFIEAWKRPLEVAKGLTIALKIVTPFNSVSICTKTELHRKVTWIPNASERNATEVLIIITKPDVFVSNWPGKNGSGTELIGCLNLDDGSKVWLVYRYIDQPVFDNKYRGKVTYFKDAVNENPETGKLKAMLFGDTADGTKVIYDLNYSSSN